MTRDSPNITLLTIPGQVFIESPNAYQIISCLTKRLNTGYDKPRFKYNIIKSTRIKNEAAFLDDLGIYVPGSLMLILIVDKDVKSEAVLQALKDGNFVPDEAGNDFSLKNLSQDQILGTIAVKPKVEGIRNGWEITGFTSFENGVGGFLLGSVEKLAIEHKIDFLFASVIYEHELVPYYYKYGFKETGNRLLLKIDETGKVKGGTLENGIYASQDFHISGLIKYVQ